MTIEYILNRSQRKGRYSNRYGWYHTMDYTERLLNFIKDNNLDNETFRSIKETNGKYLVSLNAIVISMTTIIPHLAKVHRKRNGYRYVNIGRKKRYLHILVAEAFIEDKSPIATQVHHIDTNRDSNIVSNLVWVSPKEHYQIHREIRASMRNKKDCLTFGEYRDIVQKIKNQASNLRQENYNVD